MGPESIYGAYSHFHSPYTSPVVCKRVFKLVFIASFFAALVSEGQDKPKACNDEIRVRENLSAASSSEALESGDPLSEVVLFTHIQNEEAASRLLTGALNDLPCLILKSEGYPIHSTQLLGKATRIEDSPGGQFSARINADVIHLGGGFCDLCLATTFLHAVQDALSNSERKRVTVVLHRSITYDIDGLSDLEAIKKLTNVYPLVPIATEVPFIFKRWTDDREIKILIQDP